MPITPFSNNELDLIKKVLNESGWHLRGFLENYQRFSVKKNNFVLFSIKLPIELELKINFPIELIKFHTSTSFQFWSMNSNTSMLIQNFAENLKSLKERTNIELDFALGEKEDDLIELLNKLIPEPMRNEEERNFLNRVRVSIMNKKDALYDLNTPDLNWILEILKSLSLFPTFKLPWELKKGIARFRLSELLIFSNEEPEFFLLEKDGYMTYFKDLRYNKFFIRSYFETYYFPFLLKLYGTDLDFRNKFRLLLEDCVKFSRFFLNSVVEVIDSLDINKNELIEFKPEKELISKSFLEGYNNFPFSALYFEAQFQKELYSIRTDLLNTPPQDFKVLQSIDFLIKAEILIRRLEIKKAIEFLEKSLEIIENIDQIKLLVTIYLLLAKTYRLLKQYSISLKYLNKSFNLAKAGKISIEFILKIHYEYGRIYFILHDHENAESHFQVLIGFLNKEKKYNMKVKCLAKSYIYLGLINTHRNNLPEAKKCFTKAREIGKNLPSLMIKLFQSQIKEFKRQNKISQAQKYIRFLLNSEDFNINDEQYKKHYIDILLELASIQIKIRKNRKSALQALTKIQELFENTEDSIRIFEYKMRWNLLMASYFKNFEKDDKNYIKYYDKSQQIKEKLIKIGIIY